MTLTREHKRRIKWALLGVVALDAALLLVNWQAATAAPASQHAQLERLRQQHSVLGADVRNAQEIRQRLPEIEKQLDRFLDDQLLDPATGYSTIVADLTSIASESGLRIGGVTYKQRDLEKRNVVELEVATAVEGSYTNLVQFVNGLETAQRLYLLDGLSLAANTTGGGIKLNLQLRTYFRRRA